MNLPDGRARLGLGAQVKVDLSAPRGEQIRCPYCDCSVAEEAKGGLQTIVRESHRAPCGLMCAGSASRHWAPDGGAVHTGPHTCVRCIPVACPTCDGRKVARSRADVEAKKQPDNEALQRLAKSDPSAIVAAKCPTCKATGAVASYRVKKFD